MRTRVEEIPEDIRRFLSEAYCNDPIVTLPVKPEDERAGCRCGALLARVVTPGGPVWVAVLAARSDRQLSAQRARDDGHRIGVPHDPKRCRY